MSERAIAELARRLGASCRRRGVMVATAESCTGGGVAQAITRIAGSSGWFERGFVTYTDRAKREMLGVSQATLGERGAVSEEVASEMATGALVHSPADVAVAITGINIVMAIGLASFASSRVVVGVLIAWNAIVSHILISLGVLGSSRKLIDVAAAEHFLPRDANNTTVIMSTSTALLVLVVWTAIFLWAGRWWTNRVDA